MLLPAVPSGGAGPRRRVLLSGAGDRTRTGDIQLGSEAKLIRIRNGDLDSLFAFLCSGKLRDCVAPEGADLSVGVEASPALGHPDQELTAGLAARVAVGAVLAAGCARGVW